MTFLPCNLIWEDPPEPENPPRGEGVVAQIVEELQRHPGKWAIVARYPVPGSAATRVDSLKHRGCESTRRGGVVYARRPEAS